MRAAAESAIPLDLRGRPRDRLDADRPRRRPARPDADRRRRDGRAGARPSFAANVRRSRPPARGGGAARASSGGAATCARPRAALPAPDALFAAKRQRLDLVAARLRPALARNARDHEVQLATLAQRLAGHSPHASPCDACRTGWKGSTGVRRRRSGRLLSEKANALSATGKRLLVARDVQLRFCELPSSSPSWRGLPIALHRPSGSRSTASAALLPRAVSSSTASTTSPSCSAAMRSSGMLTDSPVRSTAGVFEGQALTLEFADGKGDATGGRSGRQKSAKPKAAVADQGALF